jgi:hypothetical protein
MHFIVTTDVNKQADPETRKLIKKVAHRLVARSPLLVTESFQHLLATPWNVHRQCNRLSTTYPAPGLVN